MGRGSNSNQQIPARKMKLDDVYKEWIAQEKGYLLKTDSPIERVTLTSTVGNEETFGGCEVWDAYVEHEDQTESRVSLFDMNPVEAITRFCRKQHIKIDFTSPTDEELLEREIRRG